MKSGFILCAVAFLAAVCNARLAEKVSEDDDFVVYRIPVKSLDLQSQATGYYQGLEFSPASHGRSNSKSSSHSKSSSSSTGSGKGRGYGQGGSSHGSGQGYGGSSSGHGHGSSGSGYGSGGSGYGSGGSGGSGYGSGGSGYGSGGSGGSGYGSGGSGYGSGGSGGYGGGYGSHGRGLGYGGSSYTPGGYEGGSNTQHYDEEEYDQPKILTTTKSFTTKSAQDTGVGHHEYRQGADGVGEVNYKLGDYLKNTPGHENSNRFSQKIYDGFAAGDVLAAHPGLRSGQGFNVNEFTRTLNQGMSHGYGGPSYRSNRFVPQASFIYPRAYALRHAGFGLGGF